MQTKTQWMASLLAAVTTGIGGSAVAADAAQTLYAAGSQQTFKGPDSYFTGDVKVDMLFPDNDTAAFSGAYVTFQAGARTAWHMHPAGQHMIVTDGVALTGTRDGRIIRFTEGETVWCPSDVDHWHGATPEAPMTHLVITGNRDGENVIWKEKVTDAEYHGGTPPKDTTAADLKALTPKQQSIVSIAAFTAKGDLPGLKTALEKGLDAGLSINEIKEVQIHLYAYMGFPRTLNGLGTFMAVVEDRKARGIGDPQGEQATPLPADKTSLELGKEVQTELVGKPVTGPLFDFAPAINEFLQSHLFGDLFARGILDYESRELATISALASMDGVESQLGSHMGMGSNVGLSQGQLAGLVAQLKTAVGSREGNRAAQALAKLQQAKGGAS